MRRLLQHAAWGAALSVVGVVVLAREATFALNVAVGAVGYGLSIVAVKLANYATDSQRRKDGQR